MQIAVSEAKAQLTDLVRRAEAGDDVVLTRHGQPTVRLVPIHRKLSARQKREILDRIIADARLKLEDGPSAAHAADFLYDESGLPA